MLTAEAEKPTMTAGTQHASFFRQSGWLMIANVAGGLFTWAVHFLSKTIGPGEYGVFVACLGSAMVIPSIPLQMVLAQQTAKALANNRERELTGMIRLIWLGTFVLWLAGAIIVLLSQTAIMRRWQITSPAALWITLPAILLSLWMPMFFGVLQGQQNFLWLGWSMMLNGVGRLAFAVFAVLALGGLATGMMSGVLFGLMVAVAIALWQTRSLWMGPSQPFDWRSLLSQIVPLMLGFGAFQFLFTADIMFSETYFEHETAGFYGSAGTLSRALMWLVLPLASVMFPKIVHSAAKSEKSDLMRIVIPGTAVLAIVGAVSLSLLGPWIVRFVSGEKFVSMASSLLPWYAGAMVPLALGNVLLNNLLARSFFKVVPGLCVLALAYGFALTRFHDTPVMMLKVMAFFNVLLSLQCAWFTWRVKSSPVAPVP
jgi:O-antigen/teichoic acid export membrane protein